MDITRPPQSDAQYCNARTQMHLETHLPMNAPLETAALKRPRSFSMSLTDHVLRDVLDFARPMGHNEDKKSLNIGFGFVYYGLVRALRPRHVLVIGSGFGFSVVCLALALKDNRKGSLSFVDPSYSMLKNGPWQTVGGHSNWDTPDKVESHWRRFGIDGIVRHHKLRSDEFFPRYAGLRLPPVDLAFIDGNHSYAAVQYDFRETTARCRKNSYILLHDTNIYLREAIRHSGVKRWLRAIKNAGPAFEVVDFPFASGLALVRVRNPKAWKKTP
jgi:hypothetical protein